MADDALDDFTQGEFTHEGKTRTVYRKGEGPAVIVISEIPGITPEVAGFARRVADSGFTAVMPHLFGEPGPRRRSAPHAVDRPPPRACRASSPRSPPQTTSPVTGGCERWPGTVHAELGGPGVGAVGMCFTGGFALAMMVDDAVMAPVLSQPSLPFPLRRRNKRDLGISDDGPRGGEAPGGRRVSRCWACASPVTALVPAERFERLRQELGDAFIGVEIDSSKGNEHDIPRVAHSVLTEHLVDEAGHPTQKALHQVLDFFEEKLRPRERRRRARRSTGRRTPVGKVTEWCPPTSSRG